MSEARIVFRLKRSEQLAVLQIMTEHWGCPEGFVTDEFVNTDGPPIRYHHLLKLFASTPEVEAADDAQPAAEPPAQSNGDGDLSENAKKFFSELAEKIRESTKGEG